MTKILITGGSGFIGTNLVEHYASKGFDVLNLDLLPPRNIAHIDYWKYADITDESAIRTLVSSFNPDYCFHLAARTDLAGETVSDYQANTIGVKNVINALASCDAIRFVVFASSMLVCRTGYVPSHARDYCPTTPYGHSKVEGERIVEIYAKDRIPYVIVRPTSIWGPWFSTPYRDFFNVIKRGMYVHPRGFRIFRSYGFVLNTVFQLDKLVEFGKLDMLGRTIYLADYQPIELFEWGVMIQNQLHAPKIRELPLALFKIGASLGDFLKIIKISFPLTSFRLNNMLTEAVHDTMPLKELTGSLPFSARDGVRITCDWIKDH